MDCALEALADQYRADSYREGFATAPGRTAESLHVATAVISVSSEMPAFLGEKENCGNPGTKQSASPLAASHEKMGTSERKHTAFAETFQSHFCI